MTISYPNEKQAYEDQGVIFLEDISQQYYNLTMIIHASLALNNTMLFCSVIGSDFTVEMSREVHLIVFNTLSKVYCFKSMGQIIALQALVLLPSIKKLILARKPEDCF